MHNHNSTLHNYLAVLNSHTNAVSKFNKQTELLLAGNEFTNLYCEDMAQQVIKYSLSSKEPSNVEKTFILIKEISNNSKSYLDKLSYFSPILGKLITIIVKGAE